MLFSEFDRPEYRERERERERIKTNKELANKNMAAELFSVF